MSSQSRKLTIVERQQLNACIQVVKEGMATFITVGNALMEVQKNNLYRETHDTFELFCYETFDLSSRRAYQLIEAADTVNLLSNIGEELPVRLPQTESHAKALADIEPETARQLWDSVVADSQLTGTRITAEKIAQEKERLTGKAFRTKTKPGPDADERRPKDKSSDLQKEDSLLVRNRPSGQESEEEETSQQKPAEIRGSSNLLDTDRANNDTTENSNPQGIQSDTSSTGDQAVASLLASVDQESELTRLIKQASMRSFAKEIIVIVTGKFLLRSDLTKTWIELRGLPTNFVITEDFQDYLSLREARSLGVI